MDRRKFIKTSMCLSCGAALIPVAQSNFLPQVSANFSKDKFIYKRKEDLPKEIHLEACSLCQLNCPACWVRKYEENYKKIEGFGYLKFSDFKNLIDNNPQIKEIELADNGEIFLNPELDKIIEYAYSKNIELKAEGGVNLNYLSDEMAELLVKCKFKRLWVSIDGATPEVYKIYRRGGDFNKVISNIQKINKYKKLYNSQYPELTYKFIVFGHNEHEIELAKQKAKELDMKFMFWPNLVEGYSPVKNKKLVYNNYKEEGVDCRFNFMQDKKIYIIKEGYTFCSQLFESPQINWNGNLMGCCNFKSNNFGVNVFEVGLMNALNSRQFLDAKHLVTDLSYKPKYDIPCIDCWLYKLMKKNNLCLKVYV